MTTGFSPVQKGTILLLSGAKEHIFFICNDPVFYPRLNKNTFLAVNLTSVSEEFESDNTCILNVGDHPFVKHPSYIFYRRAEIFGTETVTNGVSAGDIRVHQPCEIATFQRILDGFAVSPHVTPKIKGYYQRYCVPSPAVTPAA